VPIKYRLILLKIFKWGGGEYYGIGSILWNSFHSMARVKGLAPIFYVLIPYALIFVSRVL
jgi:hypothetical protein